MLCYSRSTNLNREDSCVEEPRHLRKNPNVPVFEERWVVRWPGADVQRVRCAGCPGRADEVRLVEHVLVSMVQARRTGYEHGEKKINTRRSVYETFFFPDEFVGREYTSLEVDEHKTVIDLASPSTMFYR